MTLEREAPSVRRRQLLALAGVSAVSSLAGLRSTAAAGVTACVVRPRQTEGPYFVDERLHRSDIRSDPADGSVRPGVPLRLAFHLSQLRASACAPLTGALVDVWHCDALGVYSDVRDGEGRFDTRGKKFLRGYQVSDQNGAAEFLTVYPGWYPGRAVHIHFMVRADPASGKGSSFASQLYFDDSLTDVVHRQAPYASQGQARTRNARDGIYRSGGRELMLVLAQDGRGGYTGSFDLALDLR